MNKHNKESGYTLIGVLLIFIILATLGMSLVTLSLTAVKNSTSERDDQSAFYIAEAGMTFKLNKIEEEVGSVFSNNIQTEQEFIKQLQNLNVEKEIYADFKKVNNIEPYASIDVAVIDNNLQITSTGVIDNEKRTVQMEVKAIFNEGEPVVGGNQSGGTGGLPSYGLMIGKTLRITGSNVIYYGNAGMIKGSTIIDSPNAGQLTMDKPAIDKNGNEYDGLPSLPPFPTVPYLPYLSGLSNSDLTVNGNHTIKMDVDGKINTLKIQKNRTLTIQINDTRNLSVNNLEMEEGSTLNIKKGDSSNELYLHVNNGLNITNSEGDNKKVNFNADSLVNRFYMFYGGKNKLDITNVNINGSLYVKDADVNFSNVTIVGNLFSGGEEIKLTSSLSREKGKILLAPNAHLFSGDLHFFGKLIVNSLNINGALNLTHQDCLNGVGWQIQFCSSPRIEGPISMQAVHDFNSDETEFPGYPGIPEDNQNGSNRESSFEIKELTPVREISQ